MLYYQRLVYLFLKVFSIVAGLILLPIFRSNILLIIFLVSNFLVILALMDGPWNNMSHIKDIPRDFLEIFHTYNILTFLTVIISGILLVPLMLFPVDYITVSQYILTTILVIQGGFYIFAPVYKTVEGLHIAS